MATQRITPAWIVGLANLPFGLVAGFCVTALPFLLTRAEVSVDRVAGISAVVMSPTFWAFLVTPLVDVGLTRRTWAIITALISAASVAISVWTLSPSHLMVFTALLLLAELSIVLFGAALGGWQASFLPDEMRGKVAGWTNVANLGGGAFGSMIFLELAEKFSLGSVGIAFAALCVLPVVLLYLLPTPKKPEVALSRVMTQTWRKAWEACRRRECLVGFALFLAPASCAAAIDLFSGLGKDFHAEPQRVIWVTGAGCAITSALGALIGGFLADRINRGYLYLLAGLGGAAVAVTMGLSTHTAFTFTAGVLAYNMAAGVSYAAFSALGFQLVGQDNPVASTVLGLFAAASNGAIVYVTWLDGIGYRYFGATGLLFVDAAMSLLGAIPLFWLVRKYFRHGHIATDSTEKLVTIAGATT